MDFWHKIHINKNISTLVPQNEVLSNSSAISPNMFRVFFPLFLAITFCIFCYQSIQAKNLDSLLIALHKTQGIDKVNVLLHLAHAQASSKPQETIEYGDQAVKLSQLIEFDSGSIQAHKVIGVGNVRLGNLEIALEYFKKSLAIANKKGYQKEVGENYFTIGTVYHKWGEYEKALSYYHDGLAIAEKFKDIELSSSTLNAIAMLHSSIGDDTKALSYYYKFLEIVEVIPDTRGITIALNNIAVIYTTSNRTEEALSYLKRALTLSESIDNLFMVSVSLHNIGTAYLEKGEYDLAEEYLSRALVLNRKRNDKEGIAEALVYKGDLYQKKNSYQQALSNYLEGLVLFKELKSKQKIQYIYQNLSITSVKLNDYKKAYEYQGFALIMKDSLFNDYKNQQIQELAIKYESEQKEIENELLKERERINSLELKQKTILGWILGGITTLITFMLYWVNRQKKLKTKQLEKEVLLLNENIKNKEIITEQAKSLQKAEQQKNKIFTDIAHEFQTPLSIIQGLSNQIWKTEKLTSNNTEALGIIIRNSKNLSKITNQILKVNMPNQKQIPSKSILFSLPQLLDSVLPEFHFLAKEKSISLVSSIFLDKEINIYSDLDKIETILKNLLSNAIKYTNSGGTISIDYSNEKSGFHQITIKDDGQGIAEEELPTLFDRYFQSTSIETKGGFGLGLAICKEYIESLYGTIKVESQLGKGSTFSIIFPIVAQSELEENIELYQFPGLIQPTLLKERKPDNIEQFAKLLIIEDNLDFCKYLESILKKDYHLAFVHDGQEAINYLKIHKPTLIITDWMMKGIDGLDLVKYLRNSKEYYHYPILMLTARSLVSDKLKALRAGLDDYLTKPIEEEVLKSRINYHLKIGEERQESIIFNSTLNLQENDATLSLSNQEWLINLEKIIFPLIGDFDLNLDQIAKLTSISIRQLNRKLKEITGLTTKKYIQELRYWEARRVLEEKGDISVKAVCFSVGFKDVKNFSRRFKERFGKYPSEF